MSALRTRDRQRPHVAFVQYQVRQLGSRPARSCRTSRAPSRARRRSPCQRLLAAPQAQQLDVAVTLAERRPLAVGQRALDRARAARRALDVDADLGVAASAITAQRRRSGERLKRRRAPGSSGLPCGPAANSHVARARTRAARRGRSAAPRARRSSARSAAPAGSSLALVVGQRRLQPRTSGWRPAASSTCQTSTSRRCNRTPPVIGKDA